MQDDDLVKYEELQVPFGRISVLKKSPTKTELLKSQLFILSLVHDLSYTQGF